MEPVFSGEAVASPLGQAAAAPLSKGEVVSIPLTKRSPVAEHVREPVFEGEAPLTPVTAAGLHAITGAPGVSGGCSEAPAVHQPACLPLFWWGAGPLRCRPRKLSRIAPYPAAAAPTYSTPPHPLPCPLTADRIAGMQDIARQTMLAGQPQVCGLRVCGLREYLVSILGWAMLEGQPQVQAAGATAPG